MSDKRLFVWHKLNDDSYYYKVNSGLYKDWEIGDINQYDHQLVLIIENEILEPIIISNYVPLRKKVLTKLISFLQKINKWKEKKYVIRYSSN